MFTAICNFLNPFSQEVNPQEVNPQEVNPQEVNPERSIETSDPKLLVSINKTHINTDSFFLPFMGKHNLVRHWVIFNPDSDEKSIYSYPAWMGNSQKISTEMIALGCKNRIDQLFEKLLLSKNKKGSWPELILIQTTGYYPLGIFINTELSESSRAIIFPEGEEEARELIKNIDYISIANID